jgi:hypothetical protein
VGFAKAVKRALLTRLAWQAIWPKQNIVPARPASKITKNGGPEWQAFEVAYLLKYRRNNLKLVDPMKHNLFKSIYAQL